MSKIVIWEKINRKEQENNQYQKDKIVLENLITNRSGTANEIGLYGSLTYHE